ncbi:hypothetical protein ACHAQA_006647 [Verticillium albo-atrum]
MYRFKLLACVASLGLSALGSAQALYINPEAPVSSDDPLAFATGRYIVQFSEAGSAKFRKRDGSLNARDFFVTLEESTSSVEPVTTFDSTLFHGASFDLRNGTAGVLQELEALPEVERIWPAGIFTAPETAEAIGLSNLPPWNPHNDTGVAAAHARGYRGEGFVVAVVDTGIDYTHPSLGGGLGPGFKVERGYDLVGDDWVFGDAYTPDDDPQDCRGHGTHVAGIIASTYEKVPGVAPDVRLWAYKVFGCGDGTTEDVILAAFIQAHEDGADIINASLGSDRGFPDGPLALVASAIQAAGTFVSIAAGNAGERGPFFTSSGGNVVDGAAVGSVQHDEIAAFVITATSDDGETRDITYVSSNSTPWDVNATLPVVFNPVEFDPCSIAAQTVPVKNAVLINRRPSADCGWQISDSILFTLVDYVFYYNSEGADWEIPRRNYYDPIGQPKGFALISYEDGTWLRQQYDQGRNVSLLFTPDKQPAAISRESYAMGRINEFSSWGPTLDARMKPDISAPGGSIFSTWPVDSGSWAVISGTSMAAPYIAGVAALYLAANGGREVLGTDGANIAYRRIVASGKPVLQHDLNGLASVGHQGAGLVDALKVLNSKLDVSPAVINLNDTVNYRPEHVITVVNQGDETARYQVVHDAGVTTNSRRRGDAWITMPPTYSSGEGNIATVELSTTEFTLQAGESATVTATFVEPLALDSNILAVYGGGIVIASDQGDVSRVPYMGIKGSLYAADIWEMHRGAPIFWDTNSENWEDGRNFTLASSLLPAVSFNMLFSTRELSIEYVDRNWTESDWAHPVVPGKNKIHGSYLSRPVIDDWSPVVFPLYNLPRSSLENRVLSNDKFASGEEIPAGEYRLLARTLRTFGDPNNLDDWQWKLSPWFYVTGEKPPPPTSTATSQLPTTTGPPPIAPTRPCSETSRPIDLKVRVGGDEELRPFYRSSDFLAVDFNGTRTHINFELDDNNHLLTPDLPSSILNSRFASIHPNNNSLVYMYPQSRITAPWAFLDCSIVCENRLKCVANNKAALYTCETGSGLIRSGPVVLEGCQKLHLFVEELECGSSLPAIPTVTAI